ncbi:basic amino acid ABC transporter substrate-binding protein [Campylobacter sp. CCUG 57310]|uniref:basic amino acid ABC transporter substrate-binding protein n=1 Tax=Campylobacter sp. CCUG 57310 TaxID=2517362 RepID=UPI001565D587|nr:basic amino acid ABC transporter substrate-binding protein [Campylobacter sp. CCUG 57310]QKF92578.1 amino acid ABC transporter, periplasmic arginine/lysine/histidine-binding protein [Campylobacter sp. CCUG 57310]
MKKLFALLLAGLVSLGATELKVGTAANYPPFEFIDDQNKIAGFDIDLIDALSKKVGFKYQFVNMNFDGLIVALKTGKINVIASAMSATDERRKSIDFTDAYYLTENIYLRKKGNDAIKDKESLSGKKVGVQLGTVQEMAAKEIKGAKVTPAEETVSLTLGLKTGKLDAVIFDSSIGYGYLKKNPDLEEFHKESDGSEGFSIAFDKDKNLDLIEKINAALKELKQDGTYDKLLEKYDLK